MEKVDNNFIRYANCWEDADRLLSALALPEGKKIVSIGSAGDNSFSLLTTHPQIVVAVDVNAHQLNLIELKKAAFKALDHDSFLQFLGFEYCENRDDLYKKVRICLNQTLQSYWDERLALISSGIIHQGKFEKYFRLFREKILVWIHSPKKINQLFEVKSSEQQTQFYHKSWNNWRWKLLFKIFFSKAVLGKYGRDPEFMNEVKQPVSSFIWNKTESHLTSIDCQQNYFLRYILKGDFGEVLPHYARPENFDLIKNNIDKLSCVQGYAQEAYYEFGAFDAFNLSNIFEYMDKQTFEKTTQQLVDQGNTNAKYAYWNLMVPRHMANSSLELIEQDLNVLEPVRSDMGFFYDRLHLNTKK